MAERGTVAVGTRPGVVEGPEPRGKVAPGKVGGIAAGGDHGQDRLARGGRVGRSAVGSRGEEAERTRTAAAAPEDGRVVACRRRADYQVGRLAELAVYRAVAPLRGQQVLEGRRRSLRIGRRA